MIASLKLRTYQIRLVWKLGKAISSIADIQLYLAMICSSLTLLLLLISNAMAEVSRWNSHFPISVLIFVWKKDTLLVDFIFLLHKSQRWKQPVSLPQGTSLQQSGRVGQPTKKDFQRRKLIFRRPQQHSGGKIWPPMRGLVRQGSSLQRFSLAARLAQH